MASPRTQLLNMSSLLMASLFAISASVQFDDPDWYFWFPLYTIACVVNLVNGVSGNKKLRPMAKFGLWFGVILFIKVVIEDFVKGIAGFWSLDMRERVVREKFGSGLVISSMLLLQLEASPPIPENLTKGTKSIVAKYVEYGMAALVSISYGLFFVFFVFQKREMRF